MIGGRRGFEWLVGGLVIVAFAAVLWSPTRSDGWRTATESDLAEQESPGGPSTKRDKSNRGRNKKRTTTTSVSTAITSATTTSSVDQPTTVANPPTSSPGSTNGTQPPSTRPTGTEPSTSQPSTTVSTITNPTTTAPATTEPATTSPTSQPSITPAPTTAAPTTRAPSTRPPTTRPVTVTTSPPGGGGSASCPGNLSTRLSVSGQRTSQYRNTDFADNTFFDATDATWSGRDASGQPIPWLVTLRSSNGQGRGSCWDGGVLRGPWDDTDPGVSWEDPYHHAGGLTIDVPQLTVVNLFVQNQGDGIHIIDDGADATLRRIHLTDIHDDCIENDYLHNLTVSHALLDGCYVAFSARTHSGNNPDDGSANVWRIENSLVRLEPQPTVYRGPSPGHGGFFKWDDGAPRVALHNTVFRVDQAPNHGTIGIPPELSFASCSNNTMVWLGAGDFPEALPSCFTVTTDRSVWDRAVAAWHD